MLTCYVNFSTLTPSLVVSINKVVCTTVGDCGCLVSLHSTLKEELGF